jgi:hypothetical protein
MRRPEAAAEGLFYAALAVLSVWIHVKLSTWPFDDALIHFRIAEHLARDGAPYFVPDQPVMASSSPVWTLLLALISLLLPLAPWLVATLNALLVVAGACVWASMARQLGGERLASWAPQGFAVLYVAMLHFSGAGLMETPLALLALGAGLLAVARARTWGFLLLGLASFVRPELVFFLLIVLALQLGLARPAGRVRCLLWALVGSAPFALYQLVFYGSLIPYTAVAKKVVYSISARQAALVLIDHTIPFTLTGVAPALRTAAVTAIVVALVSAVILEARNRLQWARTDALLAAALGGGLAIALAYFLTRGLVFPWYVPLYAVPVGFALWVALARARSAVTTTILALVLAAPYAVGLASTLMACAGRPELYRYFAQNARVRKYVEVGQQLFERYPDATLMSSEIGGLGRGFRGRVVDGVGLISPAALKYHPMRVPEERSLGYIGAIPVGYVREVRPELIVSLDVFIESFVRSELRDEYDWTREPIYVERDLRVARSPVLWGSKALNVFVRKDVASAPSQD